MCSFLLVSCVFSYFNPLDRSRCFPVIYEDKSSLNDSFIDSINGI